MRSLIREWAHFAFNTQTLSSLFQSLWIVFKVSKTRERFFLTKLTMAFNSNLRSFTRASILVLGLFFVLASQLGTSDAKTSTDSSITVVSSFHLTSDIEWIVIGKNASCATLHLILFICLFLQCTNVVTDDTGVDVDIDCSSIPSTAALSAISIALGFGSSPSYKKCYFCSRSVKACCFPKCGPGGKEV